MPAPVITQVTICNSALLKVGGDIISSIDEGSRASIVCSTLYQYLADEVMGSSPWRFATKSVVLAPNATVPPFRWLAAYDIPNDCLRPLELECESDWTVEGTQILCNDNTSINFRYLFRNEDPSTWDGRFAEAFAWRLAMELALSLTQSIPVFQQAEKSYNAALSQARSMNAVVGTIPPLVADIWSRARKGYRYPPNVAGQGNDDPLLNT